MRKEYCKHCRPEKREKCAKPCPTVEAELYAVEHGPKHRRKKRIELIYFHQLPAKQAAQIEQSLYGDHYADPGL